VNLNGLAIDCKKLQMELKPKGKKTCGKVKMQLDER
jgi:hypothetical protein